jgi:hypothetical protein
MVGRSQASLQKSSQAGPEAAAAVKRPAHQREKGLWNFLTWSFFISQIVAAHHLTSSSAHAAEAADDKGSADTALDVAAGPDALAALAFLDPADLQQAIAMAAKSINAGQVATGLDGLLGVETHADEEGASVGARTAVPDEEPTPQVASAAAVGGDSPGGESDATGAMAGTVIGPVVGEVLDLLDPILDPVITIVGDVAGVLDPVVDGVVAPVLGAVEGLVDALDPLLDGLVAPVAGLAGGLVEALEPVLEGVVAPVAGLVETLEPVLDGIVAPIAGLAGGVAEVLEPVLEGVVAPVAGLAGGVTEVLEPVLQGAVAPVAGLAGGVAEVLGPVLGGVSDPIASIVTGAAAPIGDPVGELFDALAGEGTEAGGSLASTLSALGLTGGSSGVIEAVTGSGGGLLGAGGLDDLFSGGGYTDYNLALQTGASGSTGIADSVSTALDPTAADLDLGALIQLDSDENEADAGLGLSALLGGTGLRLEWNWL